MFGTRYPIVQAPMASIISAELVAAVSNAGGLGSLAMGYSSPAQITESIRRVRALTDRPFAVNLFVLGPVPLDRDPAPVLDRLAPMHAELGMPPPTLPDPPAESFEQQVAAVLAERVPIFSFTFGIPAPGILAAFRAAGTKLVGTATTAREAAALADAGVDAIATQGAEAGGHRGTFIGRFEDALIPTATLVRECAAAVPIPIIAAGGIRDAAGVAEMFRLGAAAVAVGTAFIPCVESAAPEAHKAALLAARPGQTVVTRAVSGRHARGLPNRLVREMEDLGDAVLPYPWQHAATRGLRAAAGKAGRPEFLALWSGDGAAPLRRLHVAELIEELARGLNGR